MPHRKAYDLLIQAESGPCLDHRQPRRPSRVGMSIVDIATGATAHAAILEALIARGRTGKGADIRISMFDVMADWCTVPLLNAEAGNPPKRMGLRHPSIAPYGVFTLEGRQGYPDLDPERTRVEDALRRGARPGPTCLPIPVSPTWSSACATAISPTRRSADIFAKMTRDDLLKRLSDADIAFAEVNTMADLTNHPHLRRIEVDTPNGRVSYPAPAADHRRRDPHLRRRARRSAKIPRSKKSKRQS